MSEAKITKIYFQSNNQFIIQKIDLEKITTSKIYSYCTYLAETYVQVFEESFKFYSNELNFEGEVICQK